MNYVLKEKLKGLKNAYIEIRLLTKECFQLFSAHSLEKGMGLRQTKKGYGKDKARKVLMHMRHWKDSGYALDNFAFLETTAVIEAYIRYQVDNDEDVEGIIKLWNDIGGGHTLSSQQEFTSYRAGYEMLTNEKLRPQGDFNFDAFVRSRHSIRDFKDQLVDRELTKKAVEMANHAPSACNRQPVRVYCTSSMDDAVYIDSLITGTTGFKNTIRNFAVVTSDRSYFAGIEEFQWYVNGGIYLSFLIMAFHSMGIGSIVMQWFAFYKTQKELKEYMGIGKTEAIVAVVGFGYPSDEVKCICAQRRKAEDTLRFVSDKA